MLGFLMFIDSFLRKMFENFLKVEMVLTVKFELPWRLMVAV